jgi:hypothetical protein
MATMDGSLTTMPLPRAYTRVLRAEIDRQIAGEYTEQGPQNVHARIAGMKTVG